MVIKVKAEDDNDDDSYSNRQAQRGDRESNIEDTRNTTKTEISENTEDGQRSDNRNNFDDNRSYNSNRDNRNNNGYKTRDTVHGDRSNYQNHYSNDRDSNNFSYNSRGNYNGNRGYNNMPLPAKMSLAAPPPSPTPGGPNDVDPYLRDPQTGLSFGTVRILSRLPKCDQQTLLNYRRLLRTPSIRLQFYRDLYQMRQRNYVDGCGEGMVRIGHRERAILLHDPYFKKKVERLMALQPVGAAIREPVRYPNDIGAPLQQEAKTLTLSKQY